MGKSGNKHKTAEDGNHNAYFDPMDLSTRTVRLMACMKLLRGQLTSAAERCLS